MRILYFVIVVYFLFTSSCKDDYENANENIKGVWIFESMQYEDSTGKVKVISGSDITLIFLDDKESTSEDDSG